MRYRPPLPALLPEYGHIQLLARPLSPLPEGEGTGGNEGFVRRKSFQAEMQEREEQELEDPTLVTEVNEEDSTDIEVPKSFAEAAMGRSRARRGGRRAKGNSIPNLNASLSISLGSLSNFKILRKDGKKSKKKWAPLDIGVGDSLSTLDSGSEFGGNTISEAFSEDLSESASPYLTASHQHHLEDIPQSEAEDFPILPSVLSHITSDIFGSLELPFTNLDKRKGLGLFQVDEDDDLTPTQATIAAFAPLRKSAAVDPTPTAATFVAVATLPSAGYPVIPVSDSAKSTKSAFDPTREPFNPTPKKAKLDSPSTENHTPTHLRSRTISSFSSTPKVQHSPLARDDDCESKQAGLARIMERLADAFDVVEWDPDLPPVGMSNSPEVLSAVPQLVAPTPTYTTVGSLVKSNDTPTFAPPIRIQRDGAGRRPPIPGMQRADNYFSMRMSPQMALPSQMNYGQLASRNGFNFGNQQQPLFISHPAQNMFSTAQIAEVNKEATVNSFEGLDHNCCSDELDPLPLVSIPDPFEDDPIPEQHGLEYVGKPDESSQYSQSQLVVGLQKFQTIQRLSMYPNPMQQVAKERLAAISAAKMKENANPTISGIPQSLKKSEGRNKFSGKDIIMQLDTENVSSKQLPGDLDFGFKFPTTAAQDDQFSKALGIQSETYRAPNPSLLGNSSAQVARSAPPVYPQPLTAGPPGQRPKMSFKSLLNCNSYFTSDQAVAESSKDLQTDIQQQMEALQQQKDSYHQDSYPSCLQDITNSSTWKTNVQTQVKTASKTFCLNRASSASIIQDTEPLENLVQYYPHGFPDDFTGQYKQLDFLDANLMVDSHTRDLIQKEKTYERFTNSLRYIDKTIEDHVQDMEDRECIRAGRKPSLRQPKPIGTQRKALTVEKTLAMNPSDVASLLLHNLFGSLLAYADKSTKTVTKRTLSKFVEAPAWMIDDTPAGRKSCFGENWGAPPKRKGRDGGWKYDGKAANSWDSGNTW